MATITAQIRGNAAHFAASLRLRLASGRRRETGITARQNHGRVALWTPVLFAAGIGGYFILPAEPEIWLGSAVLLIAGIGVIGLRKRRGLVFFGLLVVMIAAAGFGAAQFRNAAVSASVLERRIGPVSLSGRVIRVEPSEKGYRLTLDRIEIDRSGVEEIPARLRILVRSRTAPPNPGDIIAARAILQPPPSPSLPGGYDFARKAWFERIGAVGFALGPVAAALMTGERRAIPKESLASMRDSGLAHLLAICGLHIGLVAGLLFFAIRLGLALIEPVALRYPIKKIAALGAVLGAFAYLLISGATIPTQRAFLMVSIVMLAVMIDRTAISMRLVALSAMAVLLLAPESLLSASFQMSFAAVVGLVAVYEAAAPKMTALRHRGGVLGSRIGLFVAATMLTTLVASLATAPFAIYHFNRIALYGLLANLVAVPVMAMWIMPLGILSFLLMPLGLESLGLVPMGWGISTVLWIADGVAALPGAVALVPPMPTAGLAILSLGGIWACVLRGPIRFYGLPAVAAGLVSILAVSAPNVIINRDGGLVAINLGAGRLVMSPGAGNSFERDMWQRRFAVEEVAPWPSSGIESAAPIGCDPTGCILVIDGETVALVTEPAAATEDCAHADHVILLTRVPRRMCDDGKVAVSTFHIWRDGAHAIRFTRQGPVVETSRERRGDRPWSRISEKRRQYLD
jgi:competence protein ComEC